MPGQPERLVALKRRDITELISEELRRMDPDDIFEATVNALPAQPSARNGDEGCGGLEEQGEKDSRGGRFGQEGAAGEAARRQEVGKELNDAGRRQRGSGPRRPGRGG